MYTIVKNIFYYISSMEINCIFIDTYNIKLLKYKDIINYTSWY